LRSYQFAFGYPRAYICNECVEFANHSGRREAEQAAAPTNGFRAAGDQAFWMLRHRQDRTKRNRGAVYNHYKRFPEQAAGRY